MLILNNATLIDGTGSPPQSGVTVTVDRGRIAEVTNAPVSVGPGDRSFDLTGQFLMPGLIDAHTHLGSGFLLERPANAGRFATYDYAEHREQALRWGVTTVRSAGDFTPDVFEVRDAAERGELTSPRILAAGKVLQAAGGHPGHSVYFGDEEILAHVCHLLGPDAPVEEAVRQVAESGADWVKVFVSDDNKMAYPCTIPRLSNGQLRRITAEAHRLGLPVMMHVDDLTDMEDAVDAGADTIEHIRNEATGGPELSQRLLDKLTEREVWVVPTLIATKLHDGSVPGAPLVWPKPQEDLRRMLAAGIRIGVGCDSGIPFIPYGECLHMELELLCQAGMTPLEALTAATGGNARMLRMEREFGTVRPELAADLLVLGSDPTHDIRNSRDIRMVVRQGRVVWDCWDS